MSTIDEMGFNDTSSLPGVKKFPYEESESPPSQKSYLANIPATFESLFSPLPDGSFISDGIKKTLLMNDIKSFRRTNKIIKFDQFYYANTAFGDDFKYGDEILLFTAYLNTLKGNVDFGVVPVCSFDFNLADQRCIYQIRFPFRTYKDARQNNKYAIILDSSHGIDFFKLLAFLSLAFPESLRIDVTKKYNAAFKAANSDPQILDFLYETAPDFVLAQRGDKLMYADLKTLSEKAIDSWGTNENIAILNLINSFKDAAWFYLQTNQDPSLVRKLLEKFGFNYVDKLIIAFSNIGMRLWNRSELQNAWHYILKNEEIFETGINDVSAPKVTATGFAYYIPQKKKYNIGTLIFHYFDHASIAPESQKSFSPKVNPIPAYSPMKIFIGEKTIYIPAFVAGYFTDEKIDDESNAILNNIAGGVLPEIGSGARVISRLANAYKAVKIKTVTQLIEYLGKINTEMPASELEKAGIDVVFRGTTRNIKGELYYGNANSMEYGFSTSTDPVVATIFAIESATLKQSEGAKGVVQVILPKNLEGVYLQAPNGYRYDLELEIIFHTDGENLSKFAVKEIPVEDARKIIRELYGIDLDSKISNSYSETVLRETRKLSLEESMKFYKKVINLKK